MFNVNGVSLSGKEKTSNTFLGVKASEFGTYDGQVTIMTATLSFECRQGNPFGCCITINKQVQDKNL